MKESLSPGQEYENWKEPTIRLSEEQTEAEKPMMAPPPLDMVQDIPVAPAELAQHGPISSVIIDQISEQPQSQILPKLTIRKNLMILWPSCSAWKILKNPMPIKLKNTGSRLRLKG